MKYRSVAPFNVEDNILPKAEDYKISYEWDHRMPDAIYRVVTDKITIDLSYRGCQWDQIDIMKDELMDDRGYLKF